LIHRTIEKFNLLAEELALFTAYVEATALALSMSYDRAAVLRELHARPSARRLNFSMVR
jgi:hypothetical protein